MIKFCGLNFNDAYKANFINIANFHGAKKVVIVGKVTSKVRTARFLDEENNLLYQCDFID